MRLTFARVNAALKAAGIDAELVQGDGYLYFAGPAVEFASSTSVAVCRLNHLSIESWLYEARTIAAESAARRPA